MPWFTVASTRARVAGLLLAAAFVAACGSSATTAPSAGASAAASPASGDAAAALDNLTSYKFKVGWTSTGVTGGSMAMLGAAVTVEGTAVLKPTKASDVTMNLGAMKLRVVNIADKSWVDIGTGLIASTDSSNSSMADAFSPDTLASSFMGSSMAGVKTVGDETKNGVATTHLQADAAAMGVAASSLASAFGVDGTWTVDLWTAKDGGYLVSMVMAGTGTSSGQNASFSMSIDITDVNNPANVVATPS